jgi:hypothetical protein
MRGGAQRLELRGRAVGVELLDRAGDGRADARDLAQPALRDDLAERHRQRQQALGRPRIGACLVGVLAREHEPLADLDKQLRHGGCVEGLRGSWRGVGHVPATLMRPIAVPCGGRAPRKAKCNACFLDLSLRMR